MLQLNLQSFKPKLEQNTSLVQIYETKFKPVRSCPEIVMSYENEKCGMSYPEDQCVHQSIDTRTLKLGATAVLHQLGVWAWQTETG